MFESISYCVQMTHECAKSARRWTD